MGPAFNSSQKEVPEPVGSVTELPEPMSPKERCAKRGKSIIQTTSLVYFKWLPQIKYQKIPDGKVDGVGS